MTDISFHSEQPSELFDEIMPLFEKHFAEILSPDYPDFKITPDYDLYKLLEQHGAYRAFTVRTVHSKLVGYAGFFTRKHPHTGIQTATQDLVYISPEFRGIGQGFFEFIAEQLKTHGMQMIVQTVTPHLDFSSMLLRSGYRLQETNYSKRLDT